MVVSRRPEAGRYIRSALRDIWRCLPDLVFLQVGFEILTIAVLTPTVAWLVQVMISRSGDQAIGNLDILSHSLSPAGLLTVFGAGGLILFLTFLRVAGIACIGHAAADGHRVSAMTALDFIRIRLGAIARLSLLAVVILLTAVTPLAIVGYLAYRGLLGEFDINYYIESGGPEFQAAIAVGLILVLVTAATFLVTYVACVFGLMEILVGDERPGTALRRAAGTVLRNLRFLVPTVTGWIVGWLVITAVVQTIVSISGSLAISAVGGRTTLLAAVLAIVLLSSYVSTLVPGLLLLWGGHFVLVRLYRTLSGREREIARMRPPMVPLSDRPDPARTRRVLVLSAVLVIASAVISVVGLSRWQPVDDRVQITAHRGSSAAAPENTLAAIEQAIQDGADFVEIDVRLTSDSTLVLSHDADLMRTAGEPFVVSETTLEELRQVDVGRLFSEAYAGERIPTLEEAVRLGRDRVRLAIEIKSSAGDGAYLVERVLAVLKQVGSDDPVVLSLRAADLQHVRRLDPDIPVGFLTAASAGRLERLDVDLLAVSARMAGHVLIAEAHAEGKEVWVWTLDDMAIVSRMIERGVDNIITNEPAAVAALLEERAEMDPLERMLLRFRDLYMP